MDTLKFYIKGSLEDGYTINNVDINAQGNPADRIVILGDCLGWDPYVGALDDVRIYNRALTADEVLKVMQGGFETSSGPSPADGAADVPRDVLLGWSPGQFAQKHDVYFATMFDDVNDADRANPLGLLASQGQDANSHDPGRFEFGQTYYWRVDEVNGAPDHTIFKGDIWSFTTERLAYLIETVVATANGTPDEGAGSENTVNGSGLNAEDQHSTQSSDMWVATPNAAEPLAIQFEFDRFYKLHQMLIWNYNVQFELLLGFGIKTATVEYSADGAAWTSLGEIEPAQATATETYTPNTTVDFGGVAAQYVRLTVNSGFGMMGKFGLSEVRFLSIPVHASESQPAEGAGDINVGTSLRWKAGREAASYEVYLSTDPNVLTLVGSVADNTIDSGPLNLATTYYWRVHEVNEAEAIMTWEGQTWSFATEEFIVVEDFDSYDDDENLIYDTWIDGWINETGSTVGYLTAPFAEQTTVHGGNQSMPLLFGNTNGLSTTEAERAFAATQD